MEVPRFHGDVVQHRILARDAVADAPVTPAVQVAAEAAERSTGRQRRQAQGSIFIRMYELPHLHSRKDTAQCHVSLQP